MKDVEQLLLIGGRVGHGLELRQGKNYRKSDNDVENLW